MKKTCNGCRAYKMPGCELGYKTTETKVRIIGVDLFRSAPAEECPKPKTYDEYITEMSRRKQT